MKVLLYMTTARREMFQRPVSTEAKRVVEAPGHCIDKAKIISTCANGGNIGTNVN